MDMSNQNSAEPCGETDVYQEEILEHSRNPHNKRIMDDPCISSSKRNMSCGDTMEMFVKLSDQGTVSEVAFDGVGCAISQAAASMLTEHAVGKTLEELAGMTKEDVFDLLGTEIGPARIRCAMLALETLQRGIQEYEGEGQK